MRDLQLLLGALISSLAAGACHAFPADWTTPLAPFRISGNLYYVGSRDLASYLVATPQGNILIDTNLESSPPQIRDSVEKLGFRWEDIKVVLNSQAHPDHVAGSARILQETGARQMVMEGDADVVESGGAMEYDPTLDRFPPSRVDRVLHDGDTVTLGDTTLTAHKTAGHTRGCTTWTLQTREGGQLFQVVIVGGWALNPGLLLLPGQGRNAAYPGIAEDFDRSFARLEALPCDIFLGAHGVYFDLLAKLDRLPQKGLSVWVDPHGYHEAVHKAYDHYRKEFLRQQRGLGPAP